MALARQRFAHARRQLRLLLGGRARIDRHLAFGFARHSSYTLLGWVARAMVRSSRSPAGASRSPGGASRVERQRYPLVFRARRCALTGAKGVGSVAPRNPSRRSAPTPRSIDDPLSRNPGVDQGRHEEFGSHPQPPASATRRRPRCRVGRKALQPALLREDLRGADRLSAPRLVRTLAPLWPGPPRRARSGLDCSQRLLFSIRRRINAGPEFRPARMAIRPQQIGRSRYADHASSRCW